MKLQIVGCNHHNAPIEVRQQLAFSPDQTRDALARLSDRFPRTETVLLSTCNRVELYAAAEDEEGGPTHHELVHFLADYHGLDMADIFDDLFARTGEDAVRHLFMVAASMDSMLVGEAQILSQVKQAYDDATAGSNTGPLTHAFFQAAIRVAKRVARETTLNQRRVSIPSVAVADFAREIFDQFDNKRVLVIGSGDMGEETLRYLIAEGVRDVTIINRNRPRADQLARRYSGRVAAWENLADEIVQSDLVISTTSATEPILTLDQFRSVEKQLAQRPLFVLDLAVPRDFDPRIGNANGVFLYSVDDLATVCEANRKSRQLQWPAAERIIDDETAKFMAELQHRTTGPTIRRLKNRATALKQEELVRLMNKLDDLDDGSRREVQRSFDRLVNKLLHPPLESLRDEAASGSPHNLLEALKKLFQLKD